MHFSHIVYFNFKFFAFSCILLGIFFPLYVVLFLYIQLFFEVGNFRILLINYTV